MVRIKFTAEDGTDVEGDASEVRYYDDDGTEVEGHAGRAHFRDDEVDTEGHGMVFRVSSTDPDVVATLGRIAGTEGSGEADLTDRRVQITMTDADGTEVEGHAGRAHFRDDADGNAEVEVEGHAARGH